MFNTDSYGIPDIESTLAFDEYPGNLKSFQVRIAQAIYWYRANKIFISESQVKYLQELNYLYKCIWLENLTIPWKNTLKIGYYQPLFKKSGFFFEKSLIKTRHD